MITTRTLARSAGLSYLMVALCGGFSQFFVRSALRVPGNAAATTADIAAHPTLFRMGFIADLLAFTCFLVVGLILYSILNSVNPRVAVAMLVLNAVSVAISALNMLNHLAALFVATNPTYTGSTRLASSGLVLLLLDLHQQGYLIAQIFFGLFLLPLGYLVYRSGTFPRILGVILMIGCVGYLAGVAAAYGSPTFDSGFSSALGMVGGIAELIFIAWLLLIGPKPRIHLPAGVPRPEAVMAFTHDSAERPDQFRRSAST